MVSVKGKIIATATVDPIPGNAPKMIPNMVPKVSTISPSKVRIMLKASGIDWIIITLSNPPKERGIG